MSLRKAQPKDPALVITGNIRDSNIAIILNDGSRVECLRPNAIGCQYPNSNTIKPPIREWNINPVEVMGRIGSSTGVFIVGKWGSGTDRDEDVVMKVPFSSVVGFEELPAPKCLVGCVSEPGHTRRCNVTPGRYASQAGITTDEALAAVLSYIQQLDVEDFLEICSKVINADKLLKVIQQPK